MEFFHRVTTYPFMHTRRRWYGVSIAAVIGSIVLLFWHGLNLGIDFTGGVVMEFSFPQRANIEQTRQVLESLDFTRNSDDFIFDNEMIAQIFYKGYEIAEVTCPTKYFEEASSINFSRSMKYGLGVLQVSFLYFFTKIGLMKWKLLQ